MDLSRSSADTGLARQTSWHNGLTRSCNQATNRPQNHPGTKPHPAPAHSHPDPVFRISSYGTRSRSLLARRSPSPLPGNSHGVGGTEAGAMALSPGVDARLEEGVQGAVNGGKRPSRRPPQGEGPDPFRTGPRSGGGGLWNPRLYDPDQSDSPSPESSGGEDSQSDSDVIYLVSTTQDDPLASQEDLSSSPCSSLDRDCMSPLERDCPVGDPLAHGAAASLNEGLGCFLLPPSHRSPSHDSSYSDDSSYSTRDILLHSKPVVHLSQLVYPDCPGSPVDISSDDSSVMEVPVTNHKSGTDALPPRLYVRGHQGGDAASPRSLSPQPRARSSWVLRRSPRAPKAASSPVHHTPTRTVYSRGAKTHSRTLTLSMHSESLDSVDMMDSTERQSSSDEDDAWPQPAPCLAPESEDSDGGRRMVREVPVDRHTPSTLPQLTQRGLSSGSLTRSQSSLPASPPEADRKPQLPLSPSGTRKRLTKRKPAQSVQASAKQPAKPCPASRAAAPGKTAGKTASKNKTRARPQRKKHKAAFSGPPSCSLFSPQEPEIQLRYARTRERKEHKSDNFCPFIHVERRECTVVNYQEEELGVRGDRGQQQGGAAGSGCLSGLVPRTSCFKLGRISSHSRGASSQVCCLCGGSANTMGLGDLHGPYYPSTELGDLNHQRAQSPQQEHNKPGVENGWHGPSNGHRSADKAGDEVGSDGEGSALPPDRLLWTAASGAHSPRPGLVSPHSPGTEPQPPHNPAPDPEPPNNAAPDPEPPHSPGPDPEPPHSPGPDPEPPNNAAPDPEPPHSPGPDPEPPHSPGPDPEPPNNAAPDPEPPHSPGERWVHEDCGIWSAGVFLVKGKLYGLEEAVRLARETVCTACGRPGATMGCFLKSCPTKYHYRCACQSGCALNEDNFSIRCPKHKNKTFQGVTRQAYR